MTLQVNAQPSGLETVAFTFVVPGNQQWKLRSVLGVAEREPGGIPNRSYALTVTDGTNIVAASGAADAGTEPGSCTVTWCDSDASSVGAGSVGVSVAPLPPLILDAGYVITATITSPASGDQWVSAVAWYDFTYVSS